MTNFNKTNTTPIVVVAFNRASSLARLLSSLARANYSSNGIPLIISIDYADNNEDVFKIANDFQWNYGEKVVNYNKVNLGLRKHILKCGAYAEKYGSVIILEDDLFVSPAFYEFAVAALEFSLEKDYIGGVSLYNHQLNVQTLTNFSPMEDGFDNWYFQFASSWGQAWNKKQWLLFHEWYSLQKEIKQNAKIPAKVVGWSQKSWLKYFVVYLIEKNKYFLYPKVSHTTNFSDIGTHNSDQSTAFQVPLLINLPRNFVFSSIKESESVYDAFYENLKLEKHLNLKNDAICINLYGQKTLEKNKRYLLTTKILNYKILRKFGQVIKPIEANIIENISGKDIFLYDCHTPLQNNFKNNKLGKILYQVKILTHRDAFDLLVEITRKRIISLFRKYI